MMKRTVYEAPHTERFSVELEGGFMSASIANQPNESAVTSTGHELNEVDLSNHNWNDGTNWE